MTPLAQDRALAALTAAAMGDALGMPSQTFDRAMIARVYGRISDFVAPVADHPVSHGLEAATITDDTEQALLLGRLLVEGGGHLEAHAWARGLLDWEADVRARGLRDLLGPSSKRALDALLAGADADDTGREGTTNGAAMRIGPLGIAVSTRNLPKFVERVAATCKVTHNTREAISSAAAVAAVISQGIDGMGFEAALPRALDAAARGALCGHPVGEADMAGRIRLALDLAAGGDEAALAAGIGTSVASRESVAAAFGVVRLAGGDPWRAALIAANIGDDTDTIGTIAAGMAGACRGMAALPSDKVKRLLAANRMDLAGLVRGLLGLRDGGVL